MMSRKCALGVVVISLLAITCVPEYGAAASPAASFGVSATVQSGCVASVPSTSFGPYDGEIKSASSMLSVTCTQATPYSVGLLVIGAAGVSVAKRKMAYSDFSMPGFALIPGSGGIRSGRHSMTVNTLSASDNVPVPLSDLGKLPAGQLIDDDMQSDTVTISVTY